jgi:hypothetical protein
MDTFSFTRTKDWLSNEHQRNSMDSAKIAKKNPVLPYGQEFPAEILGIPR